VMMSLVSQVKEVLSHLGDGFIRVRMTQGHSHLTPIISLPSPVLHILHCTCILFLYMYLNSPGVSHELQP
jgi:hypothetical protein